MASRYGWTKQYMEESLYWEEFWNFVLMAANFTADEKNADLKFHFMLNADKKSARKWKDLPIPFPAEKEADIAQDKSGITQLPPHLRGAVIKEQ